MNYFAATVCVMQAIAGAQYMRQGLYWEGALWWSYGFGNVILMVLAAKRLSCGIS